MKERPKPPRSRDEEEYQKDKQEEQNMLSFNKGGHRERSLTNQPNHWKWWKKQKKELK